MRTKVLTTIDKNIPDNTLLCHFIIEGNPATKKNHQTIVRTKMGPRVIPSKQYRAYEIVCKPKCEEVWKGENKSPIDFGVKIKVKISLETWRMGDHVGYLQSLGDIFEKYGIVADDKWIFWDNDNEHWLNGKSADNPHVEVWIYRYRHPYEDYQDSK